MDKIAELLLENKIVFLSPKKFFTFSSGLKSPIYCDNRLILSYPKTREIVTQKLTMLIKKKYPDVEMIMGVATAGIPHATLVGDRLNLPVGYVRVKPKKHGRTNQIEGELMTSKKVVIIEDLVTTGKSILVVNKSLLENGFKVIGAIAIFSYGMKKTVKEFKKANLKLITLTNLDSLIKTAVFKNYISKEQAKNILSVFTNDAIETTTK